MTQNGSGVQFDVYFNFADADPWLGSIQCPLGGTMGCFKTTGGGAADPTSDYKLLPGILYSYKASADDLAGYQLPLGRCLASEGRNAKNSSPTCGRR